jgi:GAF domain-containing protein
MLLQPGAFTGEEGNALHVAHMNNGPSYLIYSVYQFLVSFGILFNLLVGDRVGLTSRGKYYLAASIFPVLSVLYGVSSLGSKVPAPRIIQDTLAFVGIFILSLAVARHQVWTERRAARQDFPLTTLVVLSLSVMYATLAWQRGMPAESLSMVVGLAIMALGAYDLTREFLERVRIRNESRFRKQLRQLENESAGEDMLKSSLQNGLDLLCQILQATGGLVAVRRGTRFIVMASKSSIPVGSELPDSAVACDELSRPKTMQLASLTWFAPSFEGQTQVAVVGIERPLSRLDYSAGHLELLAEVADQIGTIVSLSNTVPRQSQLIQELVTISRANATDLNSATGSLLESIAIEPDADFIRLVEEALRHLPDTITLGESALADKLSITGSSHIERGKLLQKHLTESIESLKPAEARPPEPLPRLWYSHAVLHDAYVECVPNREIMARLYISEGTFNRTRRNAIRGLARLLMEKTGR